MFELFKPDFEAILLSVRELPPVQAILTKWAHYISVILWVPIDQVISASQRTQGNKGRKGISLVIVVETALKKQAGIKEWLQC